MTSITIQLNRHQDGTVIATALEENELILLQVAKPDKVQAYRACRVLVMGQTMGGEIEFITDDRTGDKR